MNEKKGSVSGPLAIGVFVGFIIALILLGFYDWSRAAAASGLQYGIGIGIGVVVAISGLNQLVGYLDRISSGKG